MWTPLGAPDTMFAYCGSQWQLAGAVVEHVSGKSWAQLVEETGSGDRSAPGN